MKRKPSSRLALPLAAAIGALLAAPSAQADQIWDGGSVGPGDNNWNTAANWGLDTLPTFTNAITFTGNVRNGAVNDLTADSIIGGINLTNDGTLGKTNAFTLSGNRITLGGNIVTAANTTGSTITDIISLDMILNGNRTITTNQLSSSVQHNLTISGIISETGGARDLTKDGAGTLTLTGANTYTGTTTIRGGILQIGDGTTGSLIGAGTAATFDGALTFSGTGTFNVREAAGSTQRMGALTLSAGDATITSTGIAAQNSTLTFASLAARTAGATANFTLATNTTAAQNKITLGSGPTYANAPLNNSGSNNPGLFFGGTEYARYDTTNGYFRAVTYGTDTNAGVTTGGLQAASASGFTVTTGVAADVKLTGAVTGQNTVSLNTLNMAAQSLTLTNTSQILSVNGIISTGSTITTAGLLQTTAAGGEMVINVASGTLLVNPIIQNFGGGVTASALTKSGPGTLQFNSLNTYTGTTTINAGTLQLATGVTNGTSTLASAGITLSQGATLFFLPTTNGTQSVAAPITLSGGAGTASIKLGTNDKSIIFSGGLTGQASVAQTLAITQGASNTGSGDRQTITFTGPIATGSGGTLGVTIDFAGASTNAQNAFVNLQGQNTFTGNLTVTNSKGLLTGSTYSGAWVTIGGQRFGVTPAGVSNSFGQTAGTGFLGAGADYSGAISISNGTGLTTLSFLTSANQILRGVISGTGSLNQSGGAANAGTLTLNAANTFTGTTTVSGGKIILGNALALQNSPYVTTGSNGSTIGIDVTGYTTPTIGGLSGAVNLVSAFITPGYSSVSNLTLNPQAGSSVTYSGNIANGAMILTKTGAGIQVLSGTNSYTGGTNLTTGRLQLGKLVSQPATGAVAVTGGTLAVNLGGTGEWTTGTSGNGTMGGLLAGLGGQSGGTVSYSGNVALGFDTTNAPVTQVYSGPVGDVGTTLGITKLGANTLVLAGNNTYSGATTVIAGTLILSGNSTYSGPITVNAGTLVFSGNNTGSGAISLTGGTLQFTKPASQPATGAVTVGTGGILVVNIGGIGEWTTGTSGNGTIGGLLAGLGGQSGGTVSYSGNVTLGLDTSNATGTQTYSGAIGNVGTTLGITKLGTGTLALTGVNTYTGATTVNGGTLLLDKTGTGGTAALASTSTLVLGGGNFQMLGKTSGTTTQTLGALTLTANRNNTITLDSNGGSGTTLTLPNSAPTRGVGSSLLIDRTIANTTLSSTMGLAAAAQTTTQAILGYALVKDATGTGFAANVGGSIVRYTGADATFSGTSNSGTTNFITTPTGTSTTGIPYLTTAASPSYNSLHIDTASATGANFLALNGTVTLTQRALLMTGNNNFTIQGGQLGANNSEVIVHQLGTGVLTISSTISNNQAGSLTKTGTAPLTLDATNSYTGGTVVHAGNVTYTKRGAFGSGTITLPGGITLKKITEEGNSAGLATTNNIALNGQVTLDVDFSTAKDQWFTGVISGSGSMRVIGEGFVGRALTLANANTFTGGVTLNTTTSAGAWIQIGNANALGTGTLTINATGGIQDRGLGASTALTSGSGVANNIVINSGATFNLGGQLASGNVLLSGAISGSGNLNKSDVLATTFTLGGANTYTGNTTVTTGTLALADNAQLKFVLGATSGSNNSISGAGTVTLEGDFVIDTTAADALPSGSWTLENVSSLAGPYGTNFTVVGFTDAGLNKWTKVNGAKTYTFDETTGILTLASAGSTYASWIATFPGVGLLNGVNDDPDKDGIANAVEMVLGGNPATGMDTALLPTLELVTNPVSIPAIPAGDYLLFTYRRTAVSEAALVEAACETDTDLVGTWSTAINGASGVLIQEDLNFSFTNPTAPANTDRVRVYVPRGVNTKLFGRLNVEVP